MKTRTHRSLLALAVFVAATCLPAVALAASGWERLGTRTVGYTTDRDTISVGKHDGTFVALKLKVRGAPVRFQDIKVHFENGDVQDISIRRLVPAGGESRVIDLVGNKRIIEKVVFWYDTAARPRRRARATVELWGK